MEVTARHRYARISPTKVRLVTGFIQDMRLPTALDALRVSNKRAARLIEKVVKSAWANAIETGGRLSEEDFFVESARVDQGPTLKRGRFGDRGRYKRILKRTCHITVVLSDRGD